MRGQDARYAVLGTLIRARRPMTIAEVIDIVLAQRPVCTRAGPLAPKAVSDLLRHQVQLGRVRRVGRGTYEYVTGSMPRTTEWRHEHWTRSWDARNRDAPPVPWSDPSEAAHAERSGPAGPDGVRCEEPGDEPGRLAGMEAPIERTDTTRDTTRSTSDDPIVAEGLQRYFGSGDDLVRAVDGVDLRIAAGEVFGFLGPNGAGKSTTVRMLTTLLRPTGGTARVAGHDIVREADAVRRNIGVALQDAAIDPLMTGNELLRLQAVLYGLPRHQHRTRAGELLERVGLTAAADRRVGTYSGGMRRRLDLALSLIHEPSVLFLDEPTTGLDPMSRIALWEEIRRLNDDGTTVLLTTQYLEEADQLAERIAIIDHGVIVRKGRPAELKAEVGSPTLFVDVDRDHAETAGTVLAEFGELRPSAEGTLGVGLREGARAVSSVVRRLDEAGITVHHLEMREPSLDDVFAEATGYRLEGADAAPPPPEPEPAEGAPPGRGRRGRKARSR